MTKEAIHFGAGNIGRGFIGPLLVESGYDVNFADVVGPLIDNINTKDSYDLHILGAHEKKIVTYKKGQYSGINSSTDEGRKKLADKIATVSLITTSVGPNVLRFVAKDLAKGLIQRKEQNPSEELNVIACENLVGGTAQLKQHVISNLADHPDVVTYIEEKVGFPNCAVDRIVPPVPPNPEAPLDVTVEEFCEWDVDSKGLKGDPGVKGLIITSDLDAYVERKLFTVNTSHCVIAYLGYLKGYKTIHESISDPEIYKLARGAVEESGAALIKRHSKDFTKESHDAYIDEILEKRMRNENLVDEVYRVGRCNKRKLARNDRLVGPAAIAMEYQLATDNLAKGMAAALLFDYPEDEEAPAVQKLIQEKGVEAAFIELSGLSTDKASEKALIEEVVRYYEEMKRQYKK